MNQKEFTSTIKKPPIERRDKMTDFEILLQLKEQYESAKDSTELKLLIETFLNNFPADQSK